MNKIFNDILEERKGQYCHAFEGTKIDFESMIESVIDCYQDKYKEEEYIEFFQSMEVYYYPTDESGAPREEDKEEEKELYDFSIREYIEGTL